MNPSFILRSFALLLLLFPVCTAHAYSLSANQWCSDTSVYGDGSDYIAVCSTQSEAYTQLNAAINANWRSGGPAKPTPSCVADIGGYGPGCKASVYTSFGTRLYVRYYSAGCPSGTSWDDSLGSCVDPADNQRCLDLNSGIASQGPVPRLWTSKCLASGCQAVLDDYSSSTVSGLGTVYRGTLRYTGSCGAHPSDPLDLNGTNDDNKPHDQCTPAGAGQTMCIQPNGDHCYTSSSGKRTCWNSGETGQKSNGNELQYRQPGNTTPPPSLNLPNGDTAAQSGDPIHTSSTINNGSTTTNVTTTTTNYSTTSGADAGVNPQPGTPGGKDDGDKDGEKGSPSYDCGTPPACSSADGIGCAMLRQQWHDHCDFTKPYDGSDPTSMTGVSGVEESGGPLTEPDSSDPNDVLSSLPSGGWASRGACPINMTFAVVGTSYSLAGSQLCDILDALASLVLIAAAYRAAMIIGKGY